MTNAQTTNPAPAFYAATVAVVALGISYPYHPSSTHWLVFCPTLLAAAAAAVAGAIACDKFGAVALSAALFGIVTCINGALFFSVGLTLTGNQIALMVLFTFLCIIFISIAGLAYISAAGAFHRWFSNANPASISAAVVFANSLIIAANSAAERPLVLYGLGEAITHGIIPASVAAFSAYFVAAIVSLVAVPVAMWCRNSGNDRGISIISSTLAIVASVAAVVLAALAVGRSITSWDIVAGAVSLGACALTALLVSIVVRGYRVLLRR